MALLKGLVINRRIVPIPHVCIVDKLTPDFAEALKGYQPFVKNSSRYSFVDLHPPHPTFDKLGSMYLDHVLGPLDETMDGRLKRWMGRLEML